MLNPFRRRKIKKSVNDIKISINVKSKSWLSIEKNIMKYKNNASQVQTD